MHQKVSHRKINSFKKAPNSKDFYEKLAWQNGELVCGLDEVGRGCLAGPLIVSAVILYSNNRLKSLKDSKVLSQDELKKISPRIIENSWHSYGIINNIEIDKFNIWNATLLAMQQAVVNLFGTCTKLPSYILVDAMPLNLNNTIYKNIPIHYFPKGESLSKSIAAASIIAKTKRDEIMKKYDEFLPGYHFANNKGYGTKEHQQALFIHGKSILHRNSFLKNFDDLLKGPNDQQQTIFGRDS